jgi:gamma-glutamyl-gamma-aminobutyrate hydrolase PuuD
VVHEALPQFGIMWHPERDGSPSREDQLIIRAVLGGKSQ